MMTAIQIRHAEPEDALQVTAIYNQGIAGRGATFETVPRRVEDVDATARGLGVAKQLLAHLIDVARELGFWKLVSRIFPFNHASRAACRAVGYREVGTYEKHAALDGEWLDVVIVERLIAENLSLQPAAVATATAN